MQQLVDPADAGVADDGAMDFQRRFGGLQRLYGVESAERIVRSRVAVIGIGGVGSWVAEALARSGVSKLRLIDLDNVAESNINRQIQAVTGTVGMAKVDAMRERIAQINPQCQVEVVEDFVTPENCAELLADVDAFVDACDQVRAKAAMAAWARRASVYAVHVGAAGGKRLAHLVQTDDLATVTHDPLLAQMRYRMRKEYGAPKDGKKMKIACVYSKEAVRGPDASCAIDGDGSLNCHGYGSSVAVTATFGMCAASLIFEKLAVSEK
ncbi:MAG: ThiF family adenylyltransferase [Comamonas sp.]